MTQKKSADEWEKKKEERKKADEFKKKKRKKNLFNTQTKNRTKIT